MGPIASGLPKKLLNVVRDLLLKSNLVYIFTTAPGKVRNLVAITTLTTARLSWESPQKPNGILLYYSLKYWPLSDSTGINCYNLSNNLNTTRVEGLVPNQQYIFSLITHNSAGQGIPFEISASTMEIGEINNT